MKNPQDIKNFGAHLRKLRQENNLSQQQLADMADINKKTLQKIETSKSIAKIDVVFSIAKALEIPLEKLFGFPLEK